MDRVAIHACDGASLWPYFAPHHYMSENYSGHGAIVALFNGELAGFASHITLPSGTIPQPTKRGHRTVVLPDFQGMGIGVRLAEVMGTMVLRRGCRYFCKTSHPRMGAYRNLSPLWRATSKNERTRGTEGDNRGVVRWEVKRTKSYSHEFVGDDPDLYAWVLSRRQTMTQTALWG